MELPPEFEGVRFFDRRVGSGAWLIGDGPGPFGGSAMHQEELLARVRDVFRKALEDRFEGVPQATRTRSQGYADGYMRALLDAGLVDLRTLLAVIGGERRKHAQVDQPEPAKAVDAA